MEREQIVPSWRLDTETGKGGSVGRKGVPESNSLGTPEDRRKDKEESHLPTLLALLPSLDSWCALCKEILLSPLLQGIWGKGASGFHHLLLASASENWASPRLPCCVCCCRTVHSRHHCKLASLRPSMTITFNVIWTLPSVYIFRSSCRQENVFLGLEAKMLRTENHVLIII